MIEPDLTSLPVATAWPFDGSTWEKVEGWRFGVHEAKPGIGVSADLLVKAEGFKVHLTLAISVIDYRSGKSKEVAFVLPIHSEVELSVPDAEQLREILRELGL